MGYRETACCRVCGSDALVPLLDLGALALTGVFPRSAPEQVARSPLELVKCHAPGRPNCGLVQLRHSYAPETMFGDGYGYRSSLNKSMVEHLRRTVERLHARHPAPPDAVVLDIGSNDGTTLGFHPAGMLPIGIDPSAGSLRHLYRPDARVVADFFTAERFLAASGGRRAHIVTSIAMFYDLEDPVAFARDVAAVLEDEGVWHFEQSHVGLMLEATAYDTICHEHLEYYGLAQAEWILERAGLRAVHVEFNGVNGGSFAVTAAKKGSRVPVDEASLNAARAREMGLGIDSLETWRAFAERVEASRRHVRSFLEEQARAGRTVLGYGASTKGNVVLQHCGVAPAWMSAIAEVNADKFGSYTPGTAIPIVSEADAKARKPDFLFVLPWHFRDAIVARERAWLDAGGALVFPLPKFEIVRGGRS